MGSYVKWIAIGLCLLTSAGCASLGLDSTTAACRDARVGLAIWSALAEDSTAEAKDYWAKYRKGVDVAIAAYCTSEGAL